MGVKGLDKIIRAIAPNSVKIKTMKDYRGKSVAFDASPQIYRFVIAIRGSSLGEDLKTSDGRLASHIYGIFDRNLSLLKNDIVPVWSFDGHPPDIKKTTLQERKRRKIKATVDLENEIYANEAEKTRLLKKTFCIKDEHIRDLQRMFRYMGIAYNQAVGEAEA